MKIKPYALGISKSYPMFDFRLERVLHRASQAYIIHYIRPVSISIIYGN